MEFVFVVPRDALFPECYPQGLVPFGPGLTREGFLGAVREAGFFVERERAERTPAWKQVIPYTVVVRGDQVLLLRRLGKGGEARLHDKLSIGVGGHVNPEDEALARDADPLEAATRRELQEELHVEGDGRLTAVGILNDDSNPVGAVHVGLVQVLALSPTAAARVREADVLEGAFVDRTRLSSLLSEGADFETWSALLVRRLHDFLPEPVTRTSAPRPTAPVQR